jgi:uncharacterized membrane protein HdeD (DUF308 family)
MEAAVQKSPTGLRIIQFIMGGIAIALAGFVLANPITTTGFFLTFLGIALIVVGIANIIGGISHIAAPKSTRAINIGIGIVAIIGGFFTLAHPVAALMSLIWFISIFVFIYGAGLVATGFFHRDLGKGARIARVIIGAIVLIFSGLIMEYPGLTLSVMIILLSINLFIQGIESIISGTTGHKIAKVV